MMTPTVGTVQAMTGAGPSSTLVERDVARAGILAAARRCFAAAGVPATSMSDVADAAGMHRRGLYRYFSGRPELVEAAIVARMEEIIDAQRDDWDQHPDFVTALVETSMTMIDTGRSDPELRLLVAAEEPSRIHHIMGGPYPPVLRIMYAAWRPRFARARAGGELRADVTDEQLVEWLRGVYLQLMLRDDLAGDPESQRAVLRNFVLPSVLPAGR